MSFEKHLLILRRKLLALFVCLLAFSTLGYLLFPYIYNFLYEILSENLYVTKIHEGFFTRLKISMLIGIFLSIPFLMFIIITYVSPGLYKREKRIILSVSLVSYLLFLAGITFSLSIVLPISLDFLRSTNFFPNTLERIISYNSFVNFFSQFLLGFGICFEFPIVIVLLMILKILSVKTLIKYFKYFIAVAFFLSAILTPPDIISQILLGIPLVILYLICIAIGKVFRLG